ncbi:MAG: TIGR00725 family protein [Polyangiaceae bacterium]|nr:TIGR00725 family protein [Polyangiaceae bacterium]
MTKTDPQAHVTRRRFVLAAIGNGGVLPPAVEALAVDVGRLAIDAGFRVVTGGLSGVMEAVCRGARASSSWRDGDILGILPGYDRRAANPYIDIVVPTGMQIGRNIIVTAMADVVLVIGGGAGTLSEIAVAWQLGKPIVALEKTGGFAAEYAGKSIDARRNDVVLGAETAEEAIRISLELVARERKEPGDIGSGWRNRE